MATRKDGNRFSCQEARADAAALEPAGKPYALIEISG
jgi:hypothetical protein